MYGGQGIKEARPSTNSKELVVNGVHTLIPLLLVVRFLALAVVTVIRVQMCLFGIFDAA